MITCHSYPRSGKQWTHLRARLFMFRCKLDEYPGEAKHYNDQGLINWIDSHVVQFRHMGFNSTTLPAHQTGDPNYILGHTAPRVFFIVRDARAVLSSAYYHATRIDWATNPKVPSIDEYVVGKYGVERYCQFLNAIESHYIPQRQCTILHYEDAFDPAWIRTNIPALCGFPNYQMSDEDLEYIHFNSSIKGMNKQRAHDVRQGNKTAEGIRFGTKDSYKENISEDSQERIQKYLKANCKLEAYRKKYGL